MTPRIAFRIFALGVLLITAVNAQAHIGSPNVFFEGAAGPHAIRVVIRPPGTLPGLAQVDVKVADEDDARVTFHTVFAGSGASASSPPPIAGGAVPGDPHRFTAALPLIHSGSHRIEIHVEGRLGKGVAIVPLQASATQLPAMNTALQGVLVALGILLFGGAIAISRAAAPWPHRTPVTVATTCLLVAAVGSGAARWHVLDQRFRSKALAQPVPVLASVTGRDAYHLLRITPEPEREALTRWDALVTDHGKLMHLFLIRRDALDAFAHLHPVRRDDLAFENLLPPLPAGTYDLYGEITYESGVTETLTAKVDLPAPTDAPIAAITPTASVYEAWCRGAVTRGGYSAEPVYLDPDDSWWEAPRDAKPQTPASFANLVTPLPSGHRVVFHDAGSGGLRTNQDRELSFSVFNSGGTPAALEPYMGMRAHVALRSRDGTVFAHLHPTGSISMAAQTILSGNPGVLANGIEPSAQPANEIRIPYAFPRPGPYRLWLQIRLDGRVQTAAFDVVVDQN